MADSVYALAWTEYWFFLSEYYIHQWYTLLMFDCTVDYRMKPVDDTTGLTTYLMLGI